MRVLVQRVKEAKVVVEGREIARIDTGLLLFVGVGKDDDERDIEYMAKKVTNLRIFDDELGRMNLNIRQVNGRILSIPQFTLYADIRKGNRPGFELSAAPEMARRYWDRFNNRLRESGIDVEEGIFGAQMNVELINDGPVTIWLECPIECATLL